MLFFKEDKFYKFKGQRDLETLRDFTKDGYLQTDLDSIKEIPKRLEGMEAIIHDATDFVDAF